MQSRPFAAVPRFKFRFADCCASQQVAPVQVQRQTQVVDVIRPGESLEVAGINLSSDEVESDCLVVR